MHDITTINHKSFRDRDRSEHTAFPSKSTAFDKTFRIMICSEDALAVTLLNICLKHVHDWSCCITLV